MAAIADGEDAIGGHAGAGIAADQGAFGKSGEDIEFGDGGGGLLNGEGVGDDGFTEVLE